jgi:hypothetical protein
MKQLVSRRGVLGSAAALPVASVVPVGPMLPNDPDADARVWAAVCELLEAARTAASDPEAPQVFVDNDVRQAVAIFLKLLDLKGDDAYGFFARLQ